MKAPAEILAGPSPRRFFAAQFTARPAYERDPGIIEEQALLRIDLVLAGAPERRTPPGSLTKVYYQPLGSLTRV